jgi:hypothetical protein
MAHGSKKHVLKTVAIALAVGAGAVAVTSYAAPKIPQLMQYPWLTPVLMIALGVLLARRGRAGAGIGLAGAGGAVGFMLYGPRLMQAVSPQPSANQPQTAGFAPMPTGYPDAGGSLYGPGGHARLEAGTLQSGLYDRPAGTLYGPGSHAMGTPGDAGAMSNAPDAGRVRSLSD